MQPSSPFYVKKKTQEVESHHGPWLQPFIQPGTVDAASQDTGRPSL